MNNEFLVGLDEVIESAMAKLNVPGATVAITKGDEILYSKAFGYADLEKKIKMKTTHILPIGSSSKSFTAAASMMLVGEGKLDLDEPIRKYMPEFELHDPIASREATSRDLLCHRTGLPRHEFMWIDWNDMERKELVEKRIRHLKNNKPFRSTWQYQNHMFATMGYLIERITGKTWEDFVAERIFKPLGISSFGFKADYESNEYEFARLYTEDDEHINKENVPLWIGSMGPAGSIHSTSEQVAKYVQFMLNKGKVGEEVLIEDKYFSELTDPVMSYKILPFDVPHRTPIGYALGWTIDTYRGHKIVDHGGNVNGGTAMVSFLPEDDLGCVILVNADGSMFNMALSLEIYDRYLGIEEKTDWFDHYQSNFTKLVNDMKSKSNEVLDSKKEGKAMSHELDEYVGVYDHPGYGEFIVSKNADRLEAQYHSNYFKLDHLHYDIFTFELMKAPFPVTFSTGVKGEIESLTIPFEATVEPIVFIKKKES